MTLAQHVRSATRGPVLVAVAIIWSLIPAHAQQIPLRHFDTTDGLASPSVAAMLQDRKGYLWAGTESGLFRYNGRKFQRQGAGSPLADTAIRAIAQPTGTDSIIVGTNAEIFVGGPQGFVPVRAGARPLGQTIGALLAADQVGNVLAVSDGTLWRLRAGPDGLWHAAPALTAAQSAALPPHTRVAGVHVTRHGQIWLACGKHLCTPTASGITSWDQPAGVPEDDWVSFLDDTQGRLWVRGTAHLIRLDPGAAHFVAADPPHVVLNSSYHYAPLALDARGRLLTRTDAGLARLEGEANWREFTAANGLPKLAVRNLLTDRQGAIWLSNSGRFISRWLGYDRIESWTAAQGLAAEPVWSIVRDGNRILLATSGGCNQLDPASFAVTACAIQGLPPGQPSQIIRAPSGDIWFRYRHTMLHVPPGGAMASRVPALAGADILYADPRGHIWAGYADHLVTLPADASDHPQPVRIEAPDSFQMTDAMAMDDAGRLWVASHGVLFTLTDGAWQRHAYPARPDTSLQDLAIDGTTLWAAGYPHGVLRADIADLAHAAWVRSPLVESSSVMFAQPDRHHRLWVGTEQGVAVFDGTNWRRISEPDGLIWNDIDESSFLADADGTVWIGTGNGVSHLQQIGALLADAPLDVHIDTLKVGGHAMQPPAAGRDAPIEWSADRSLHADLAVLNFDRAPTTIFRARLVGTEEDWFELPGYDLHYGTLDAGGYDLQIVAIDSEHHAQSAILRVPFRIVPPWWRRTSVKLLDIAALLACAGLGLRVWTARVEAGRARAEAQLSEHRILLYRATHDALTGLLNRGAIMDHLAREIVLAAGERTGLAVALIDIDHFKKINDSFGHAAGDAVLCGLAAQLAGQMRATDRLGRYGGEEMLAILPGLPPESPSLVVERLRAAIAAWRTVHNGVELSATASFGVAWLQPPADTPEALIERADAALYAAKHGGRNRVSYAAPLAA